MALIVENGTGVANSNTYVSDVMFTDYAALRGVTIPATAILREPLLIKAMDYIEGYRDQFQGEKTDYLQSLQWPRYSVYIDGYDIGSNTIPAELKNAQIEAAILVNSTPLLESGATLNVQKEKVDVLERTYFEGGKWSALRTDNIDVWLNVLTSNRSTGINAMITRI
tara:strand:+ start:426 stop:926 length:501 start_codon:yes stop_codon:yes gene_type:complete